MPVINGCDGRIQSTDHARYAIHVGYEIDRATIEDVRSIIFPQSWNRMHGLNAIMLRLLGLI